MFTPSFHIDTYDCILDIASVLLTDIVQGAGLALQTQVSQAETHLRCLWSPVACASRESATQRRREAGRLQTWAHSSSCQIF